jgi:hypothetical protein
MNLIIQIVGWLGALLLLSAFYINVYLNVSATSNKYLILNFTGSLLLTVNALDNKAYPFVLVNVTWMVFSFYKLSRRQKQKE